MKLPHSEALLSSLSGAFLVTVLCFAVITKSGMSNSEEVENASEKKESQAQLNIWRNLMKSKRLEQIKAVKTVLTIDDHAKQATMLHNLLTKLFSVIQIAKNKITTSEFIPGYSHFPVDQEAQEDLSIVIENLMFFGEFLLRLPDVMHELYDRQREWHELVYWAITFTNETGFLDDTSHKVLHLVTQELGVVEKDENYVNPYKADYEKLLAKQEEAKKYEQQQKKADAKAKKQKRREKLKGPRLSSGKSEL